MTALPDVADPRTRVTSLRTQYEPGLLGVPPGPILLTWTARSEDPTARQLAHQVRHRSDGDAAWTVVEPTAGDESVEVAAGSLSSRERRQYAVRIATESGWSAWSDPTSVETGPMPGDWRATAITTPSEVEGPAPIFRTEFDLAGPLHRARLHVTALGVFDVRINGRLVSDAVLSPGWTVYRDRILVDTYDITDALVKGRNAIAVTVADGWYRGRLGFIGRTAIYGDQLGVIAQLEVDGQDIVVTGESWRAGLGEVRSASIYDGTQTDLREQHGDPSVVGFEDSTWAFATPLELDPSMLEPRGFAPVRSFDELTPTLSRRDERIQLDCGQNLAGWVRLTVRGRPGQRVRIRHAEVLEPGGELHTAALRTARATDEYILATSDETVLEPRFTFHGFRYAEVETEAEVVSAVAVAISTDIAPRAAFASSHPTLDAFHHNVVWSQRSNFLSIPTDCPQRDERLGWTGDAQAFAATANTLFDTATFWQSWLRDLELEQTDAGGVPSIVPNILGPDDMQVSGVSADTMGRAGWADAATIVPLSIFESFGQREVVRRQLDSMRRWVEHLRRRAGDDVLLPTEPFQYGDWLDPDAPAGRPWAAKTDATYVANAFYVRSARLLAHAERLVGDPDHGAFYDRLADDVADATWARWGMEAVTTQTGAALALEHGIAPEAVRAEVAAALADDVRRSQGRIATGFLGTPLVLHALSRSGHLTEAYRMLLRRQAPSWLYQVDQGATTVWERWDALLPDGSIHTGDMSDTREGDSMLSFNHYAYGAVVDWVYRNVAGLAPDIADPGYRTIHVAPRPARSLTRARAHIDAPYGRVAIAWELTDDGFVADLTVPFGSRAVLDLPVSERSRVTVDGAPAGAELRHGEYRLHVTDPAVVPL